MREIKFRAWDTKYDEMIDNALFHDVFDFGKIVENSRFVVMQYTGLKDKNGVEIYEGDICKAKYADGVRFIYEIKIPDVYEDISNYDYYLMVKEESLEVIGNVYENPELLEAKK